MIPLILTAMISLSIVNCSKKDDSSPIGFQDTIPKDSLTNLPPSDTVDFRYINTDNLVNCMLINDVDLIKDSFLIWNNEELHESFTGNNCVNNIPEIDFQDSMLIGYTTKIQSSGNDINRILTYDSTMKSLTYSIEAFTNDTAMLIVELNWITLPKYNIDTVIYNFKSIKK